MAQVRLPASQLLCVIRALISQELSWEKVMTRFVVVNDGSQGDDEEESSSSSSAAADASAAATPASSAPVTATSVVKHGRVAFSRPTIPLANNRA